MTVPVDHPTPSGEEPQPPADHTAEDDYATRRGIEDRSWLLAAVVIAFIVLAFVGMIALTALGGGTDYVPWGE
ncbi:hypothetical protein [Geodermatophilus normandii]|jgi:hypothetical protein|uniref:Uncharacterized protein n=1 Tax=Geodermatophilus normandii TaxID=1137989 RepID=A0A6P0GGM7_9ACTN|nr:hypothetical protein [Geodermatophilus normandii]NEM06427.1 hypothetical protein [Geodermatophilus normandii]